MSQKLRERIAAAYAASGNELGWRFLYSPAAVLQGADVAFVGLNPGGRGTSENRSVFCTAYSSAYVVESWRGCRPGESSLQRQVLALFDYINVSPEKVLAGNLVPFRSPDWNSLSDRQGALRFGKQLWGEVLEQAKPKLVVGMGAETNKALCEILKVQRLERVPVSWGRVSATKGIFDGGRFVGLPHLSRFQIVTRAKSAAAMEELFAP